MRTVAALALVFNALVWGLSWWPFRWLDAHGLHPLWATAVVYGACVVVLTIARPLAWAGMRQGAFWAIALGSGLTNACFNWAAATGDVVRVTLLFYLMPLWAVLLARWLLHEPITRGALLRVALALTGAAIVLGLAPDRLPLPRSLPDVLGLVGGAAFAFNNVMLRRERHTSEAARTLAMFAGGTALAALAASTLGAWGTVAAPRLDSSLAPVVAVLVLVFLLANLALQHGAARLTANVTAVIMLTEVAFAAVSSWLAGVAEISLRVLVGGALIVVAAALAACDTHAPRPTDL